MRIVLYILLVGICGSISSQTLDDYLIMAADNNVALKVKFLQYQASLEQVPQMGGLPDPELSFGYFVSPIETRVGAQDARFSAVQMFPWFGTNSTKKDVKTEIAKAKFEMFEQNKNELFYNVKESYYGLYNLEQSIRVTEENLEILATYKSLATSKFETNTGSMVDVLRIQMEQGELENNLQLLKDSRVPLTTTFNLYLNRELTIKVMLPDTLEVIELLLNKSVILDSMLLKNDQLQSIGHMQLASENSVKAAKKMSAPSFGLGINYIWISERSDINVPDNGRDAFMPLITMKIPLYRGKYKGQVKEATLNLKALENMEMDYRNILQAKLEATWVEYSDAGRRVLLYQEQIKIAEQTSSILMETYSTDGKEFEEILRIQRILLKYELEIIRAVKDKNTAVAKIESLM